jgi:hypothetical protein
MNWQHCLVLQICPEDNVVPLRPRAPALADRGVGTIDTDSDSRPLACRNHLAAVRVC